MVLNILLFVALPAHSAVVGRSMPARMSVAVPLAVANAGLSRAHLSPSPFMPTLSPSMTSLPVTPSLIPSINAAVAADAPPAVSADRAVSAPAAVAASQVLAPLSAAAEALPAPQDGRSPLEASAPLNALFDASLAKPGSTLGVPADAPTPGQNPLDPAPKESLKRRVVKQVPNAITGLNLSSGLAAIVSASHGEFTAAVLLIILAAGFDMLDGRAARLLKADGPMGLQLDSLADVVSFGAAPALLAYEAALSGAGVAGMALAAAFAFAGAYRLARFNLGTAKPQPPLPDSFTGLPIPGGAGVVAAAVLLLPAVPAGLGVVVLSVATAVAALAMVSRLPYPALKKAGSRVMVPLAAGAGLTALSLALLGLAATIPAVLFGLYLFTGPALRLLK